jgi:hypothetical protein
MRSQSAGKPEMMLREVATCHTIVDTNTLLTLPYNTASTNRKEIMYIEIGDTIAIIIALSVSTTLVITTAIKNAKLMRALRELNVQK